MFFLGYQPVLVFQFPPIQQHQVFAQEEQKHEIISASFSQPVNLPHPGYLSTPFSSYHPGVDIATGLGMPVRPITTGTVDEVNFWFFGYGNHILISHPDGFKSMYAHLGKMYVTKGQAVDASSIIGEVGLTGQTSGPHTHLEITHNGQFIDPLTILPALPDFPKPEFLQPVVESSNTSILADQPEKPENLRKNLKPDFN